MSQKIKKIVVLSIVLMISIVFSRCQNDDDNVSNPEISNVSLAKKWFKEYESGSDNYDLFQNLNYEWENAEIKKSEDGIEVIVVPVNEVNKQAKETWEQKLYLYKLGTNKYQALLFEIYPDKTNETENIFLIDSEDFNGHIVAWDLKTGFVKAANFKNNKLVTNGTVREFTSKKAISQKMAPIIADEDVTGGGIGTPIILRDVVVNNNYRTDNSYITFVGNGSSLNTGGSYNDYTSGNAGGGGNSGITSPTPEAIAKAIQKQIYTDKLPPCLKKILDDLININAGPGNIINKFSGNDPSYNYNWTMETGRIAPDVVANTLTSTYNATTGITTIFDVQQFPNATDLSWARTIVHESIHAYLTTYYKRQAKDYQVEYPVLFQEWISDGNKNLNKHQHEEIGRNLVKSFAVSLEAYGISKGYNLGKQFYEDMAWGGLENTDAFKSLPELDKNRISNAIQIELRGQDNYGNKKTQKGKIAGC